MARKIVIGNGQTLVGLDQYARIRDFYYDYVGLDNHLAEDSINRIGIWVDDQNDQAQPVFSWISDPSWQFFSDYKPETLAGSITAVNENLQIELHFLDLVYNEKNILLRQITVTNHAKTKRNIKLFFNHQFRMYGVYKKDTVYFDPEDKTIIHYKGRRAALIGAQKGDVQGFSDYSVGLSGIEGKEGTWKDAEDGFLSKNAIEHGVVDSTVGFENLTDAESKFDFCFWIAIGKSLSEVKKLHQYVLKKSPEHLLETTQDFWYAWVNRIELDFCDLSTEIIDLFKTSLLVMRTHVDNTGAIIASGDSELLRYGRDNYSYVWQRDAAFVALAFDRAGFHGVSRKFFEFCNEVVSDEGYFFHRYRCDKSLGSSWHPWVSQGRRQLPIQEDETALVLVSLWKHYEYTKDLEFIEKIYNPLIKKTANFILGFRSQSYLPFASYDLWEMKYGVHSFTAASVSAALESAANFAHLLGKEDDQAAFSQGSKQVRQAVQKNFFNEQAQYFYKSLDFQGEDVLHDETIDSSSFYGLFKFGVFDANDQIMQKAFSVLQQKLSCPNGGIARFEDDQYFRTSQECSGNPWIITTLWAAQYKIAVAKSKEELSKIKADLRWVLQSALDTGILPEQLDPSSGEQISVSPLVWSHAELVTTVSDYVDKHQSLEK